MELNDEQRWVKYPDLCDNIDFLITKALQLRDIGALYSDFLCVKHKSSRVLNRITRDEREPSDMEALLRSQETKFQNKTRNYFSDRRQELEKARDEKAYLDIVPQIDISYIVENLGFAQGASIETIESVVYQICKNNEDNKFFYGLGAALFNGSKKYKRKVKLNQDRRINSHLYLEYRYIFEEINKLKNSD